MLTDEEIRVQLLAFSDEIFKSDLRDFPDIKRRLDEFCNKNNVSIEQRNVLIETGAGEALAMWLLIPHS